MLDASALTSHVPRPSAADVPRSFRFTDAERRVFRIRERDPRTGKPITVSQWAERYRMIVGGPMPGRWRNAVTPFAVEPMDLWSEPHVREIYLQFAPQVVKTQIAFNCLGWSIDQDPGAAMYVMPDEKVTKRIARRRILPMIQATQRLAQLLSPRSEDTTRLAIRFLNGMDLMMAWASSSAEISSEDVRYLILDEVDKFPDYSGGAEKKEADPVSLAKIRTNAYPHTKKILAISSPGAAPSRITSLLRFECDEVRRFAVPCPVCGHEQILDTERVVVIGAVREIGRIIREKLGRYSCESCGMFWDDYTRNLAVQRGHWVPGILDNDGEWHHSTAVISPVSVGFHLPSIYSQFIGLSDIAAAAIRAEDNPQKKMIYVTQHQALEYKEVIETKKEHELLKLRTALPAGIVPKDALALTCGIDSHKWGFRFAVYAWVPDTLGYTMHKVSHGHIGTLSDIETLVYHTRYEVEGTNDTMGIWRAAIDTGGGSTSEEEKSMTDMVYEWLRNQPRGVIYGVKGASNRQERRVKLTILDRFPHSSKPIPGGLELHILDTAAFKSLLFWRFSRKGPHTDADGNIIPAESQRITFDADTDSDFVRELLAEELRRKRNGHTEWVRVNRMNHHLDTTVYAMAAADGEWQPSLKLLAPRLKQMKSGTVQPPPARRVRSAGVQV